MVVASYRHLTSDVLRALKGRKRDENNLCNASISVTALAYAAQRRVQLRHGLVERNVLEQLNPNQKCQQRQHIVKLRRPETERVELGDVNNLLVERQTQVDTSGHE